jgi:PTH1 family peptidyl-tRNA hydrolase
VSKGDVDDRPVAVVKPLTYMNRSGYALRRFLSKPDFDPSRDLLVLVDDAALPIGAFRIRGSGSSGGHNGLKSIQGALRSTAYARLRVGVGPVPDDFDDRSDFVLGPFEPAERETLDARLPTMVDAVDCWLALGAEQAMNRFNKLGKEQ